MPVFVNPMERASEKASEAASESVKSVKQELSAMLAEAGAQVKGQGVKIDPQAQARKQQQDAQKRSRIMSFISQFKQDEQLKNQWKMKKDQEKQKQEMEDKQKNEVKQFEIKKREQSMTQAVANAKRGKETRGKGGGA